MRGGNRESNHTRMGQEKFSGLIHGAFDRGRPMVRCGGFVRHPSLFGQRPEGHSRERTTSSFRRYGGVAAGSPSRNARTPMSSRMRFLKELKTDYIDLLLLHCVVSDKWPDELAHQMEVMAKLKRKGVIRAHGVSCHSLGALKACIDEPWVDSVHAPHQSLWRQYGRSGRGGRPGPPENPRRGQGNRRHETHRRRQVSRQRLRNVTTASATS